MTPQEIEQAEQARQEVRESLRQLAIAWGDKVHKAGMPQGVSAGIIAEEMMHLCAYFVVRGLGWGLETFLEKCGEVFDAQRAILRKEQQRKSELN